MKMTKIESARIIAESTDNPVCRSILCSKCFNSRKGKACKDGNLVAIEKAKAYIKRHESKSKKKDHILDTTKKVEEPKPIKTVGIDNSDVTLAQHEPVKDCHVNSEYPNPIRVDIPDIFYCPTHQGILRFKRSHIILKDTNNEDCLLKLHDEYPCYRTPEEALQVAKKLWNGDGK